MLALGQEYEAALAQITRLLTGAKLQIVRTFDLKAAYAEHPGGVCPYHGIAPCNCQLSVLLVYGSEGDPVTLTVNQCDGQIWISILDSPQQRADALLTTQILRALAPGAFSVGR